MGPRTEKGDQPRLDGHTGTRPGAVRKPTTLLKLAGFRSEPPMSLPSAIGIIPQARATAAPPLEPPHVLEGSYGFNVAPKTGLKVWEPAPNSGVLVFPMVMAPAPRSRSTSRASTSGTWSR